MDDDDLEPGTERPKPKNLEIMSIEALGEFIGELESEIARARQEIELKEKAKDGADAVFGKSAQ